MMTSYPASAPTPTPTPTPKRHYHILDGLRGVAALMVVIYHLFEAFSPDRPLTQWINHGYLAVDFFFLLSGFVIAYAYDDRWGRMSTWDFFKRRLIRLQPMVVMGMVIGALLFYLQAGDTYPLIEKTSVIKLIGVMLIGFTLLPLPPSLDIRGWDEMHPLDGPAWSLFFEYIANILYAVVLHRISIRALSFLVLLAAGLLVEVAVFGKGGDLIGGWSIDATQLHIGFGRLLFPFLAGMLLFRLGKTIRVPYAFAVCSVLLIAVFCAPRVGGASHLWMNGVFEAACVIVVFPAIVATGAGAAMRDGLSIRVARFFGGVSYPLYITHYPLIYLYRRWVSSDQSTVTQGVLYGALLLVVAVTLAYACLKMYDEPVRAWLARRFLTKRSRTMPAGAIPAASEASNH
jgi:peptidoglycan/LPS O-acetylase OafA/YrhL